MTAPTNPTWFLLETVESCVCAAWDDLPEADRPARCGIVPGRDVAIDECCDGFAWVRKVQQFRTSTDGFPNQLADQNQPCAQWLWAVEIGVGVVRCTPTGDLETNPPTPPTMEELKAAAEQAADDEIRVRRALACCLPAALRPMWRLMTSSPVLIQYGPAVSVGPEGGCHGFEMTLTVAVPECLC